MCIALGIEIGFTRQPTFQYPPHLVSPHSLPLFLFLSFPFFHLYLYLYLSLSPVFLFPVSFVLVWRFCLFATPLLLVLNIRIGPVFLRLPSHIPPLYPQRIPAATQQSPTNSIAFPTLFTLDRLVLHVVFLVTTFTTLFPLPYSRAFSCLPVEVEKNVGLH